MVLSILDYGNASYGGLTVTQLNTLQKVQNAAVRYIFSLYGKKRQQHISPYLKQLHFLPVHYRINFKIATLVFKSLNNLSPEYIRNMIHPQTEKKYGLRINEDAFLLQNPPAPRYSKTNGAFSHSAPKVWNALPYNIRSESSLQKFKSLLKTHFFKLAFQGSDEMYDDIDLIIH